MIVIPADRVDGRAELGAYPFDHRAIGLLDALPAIVAVHRPVAAHDGGDGAGFQLAHFGFDLAQILNAGVGGRIAAVGEGVQKNPVFAG